jgi:hypothetical protein
MAFLAAVEFPPARPTATIAAAAVKIFSNMNFLSGLQPRCRGLIPTISYIRIF